MRTPLAEQMRELATSHERWDELQQAAESLETAVDAFDKRPVLETLQTLNGRWARANRIYCECTGDWPSDTPPKDERERAIA